MGSQERLASLEITQDLAFQERESLVQRVAWCGMALFLLAALLGLFGSGLFSTATLGSPDSLALRYDRFGRFERPMALHIEIAPRYAQAGEVELHLNRDYQQKVSLQSISPEPLYVEATDEQLIYRFAHSNLQQSLPVVFYIVPEAIGGYHGHIGVGDDEQLDFSQFIYP
jgi:hypothetical protein